MEFLRRPGGKGTLVGHMLLLAFIIMLSTKFDASINQVLTGWFQAVGSVLAVVFAIYISNESERKSRLDRAEDGLQCYLKVFGYCSFIYGSMEQALHSVSQPGTPDIGRISRHLRLLKDALRVARAMDVSAIKKYDQLTCWLMLELNLSDFIGHIEDAGVSAAWTKKGELERCYGRAEEELNKFQNYISEYAKEVTDSGGEVRYS